jgi:hypothetical protein
MHIIPHKLLSDERMWAHPCCTHIQVKNRYHKISMKDVVMSSWKVSTVVSQSIMMVEDHCHYMVKLFSNFVQNSYYIIKMWHWFLYHESSYVWDLILPHIWDAPEFALKFECDNKNVAQATFDVLKLKSIDSSSGQRT